MKMPEITLLHKFLPKQTEETGYQETEETDQSVYYSLFQNWLIQLAKDNTCSYFLGHADDGVIWGRFDTTQFTTSHDVFPKQCTARLRTLTLWEARIFGSDAEVYIWKEDHQWQARLICDTHLQQEDYIAESQILWGDHAENYQKSFTLLADGSEGLRHAVPINVPDSAFKKDNPRPVRLHVRHYVDYDSAGNARIALSRLCNITS